MRKKETKAQISHRMSLIRSKWTKPERMMHGLLKSMHVRHEMHPEMGDRELGHPDAILTGTKVVLFAHGCFFHRCKKCGRDESRMQQFWIDKRARNEARDARQMVALKREGWKPVTIWEHDFKNGKFKDALLRSVEESRRFRMKQHV